MLAGLKALQDRLGAVQDSVVTEQALLEFGTRIGRRSGRNGFTFGVLAAREQAARRTAIDELVSSL